VVISDTSSGWLVLCGPYFTLALQEKKQAAKQKISQMEAELEAASEEMKVRKEKEKEDRMKTVKWAVLSHLYANEYMVLRKGALDQKYNLI